MRRALTAFTALVLALSFVAIAPPSPSRAATSSTMAASLYGWINTDRAALGLQPLRADVQLQTLATDRAGNMARANTLSHTAAGGNIGTALTNRAIQWYTYGEAIGFTTYPWGTEAAKNLYGLWKSSPTHWALFMSPTFNYVGAGFVYLSSNGKTFASLVFSESLDHTRPVAKMRTGSRDGTTVQWTWSGHDPILQTHTAGFRDFDVQYRVDYGTWKTIRADTTTTSLTLTGRPSGHYYGIRVQGRDWRGNLSAWSTELRVWVP